LLFFLFLEERVSFASMCPSQHLSDSKTDLFSQEDNETGKIVPMVTVVRRRGRLHLVHPPWYRNSLLASTGYLEFANAGDFAANVWNEIPVPRHAMILMAIGGPIALLMSIVALRDFILSWRNVQLLRAERRYLKSLKQDYLASPNPDQDLLRLIDSRLGVGWRELGTELIDRIAMDVFLGLGALLVGTGTIMAIWGAHPQVYHVSNLLSGFVGNSFAAAFGVVNALWSVYLACRFHRYDTACARSPALSPFRDRLHLRFSKFKWHAVISSVTGLVAGASSMVTAKMWWGYVVLAPCMVLQVACNRFWRVQLGYDRPIVSDYDQRGILLRETQEIHDEEKDGPLLDSLALTATLYNALGALPTPSETLDWTSLDSLLQFMVTNDLFDSLCGWLAANKSVPSDVRDAALRFSSFGEQAEITVSPDDFLRIPGALQVQLRDLCREYLQKGGRKVLLYRERYMLELVGSMLSRESE
jgi:predicted outer membrane lipoprotein